MNQKASVNSFKPARWWEKLYTWLFPTKIARGRVATTDALFPERLLDLEPAIEPMTAEMRDHVYFHVLGRYVEGDRVSYYLYHSETDQRIVVSEEAFRILFKTY